jgi:enterochelin esterase-like enzyme
MSDSDFMGIDAAPGGSSRPVETSMDRDRRELGPAAEPLRRLLTIECDAGYEGVLLRSHDELKHEIRRMREAVETFRDAFPGDSHDWRWVQNECERILGRRR